MKPCSGCGEIKSLTEFHNDRSKADGKATHCKVCKRAATQKWREENPERSKSGQKAWRDNNKEYSQAYQREWRANNKGRARATQRAWNEANQDKLDEAHQAWLAARPCYYIWCGNRKRAKEVGVETYEEYSVELGLQLQKFYEQPCARCGSMNNLEIDHIVALADGGPDLLHNMQTLCRSCNVIKSNITRKR